MPVVILAMIAASVVVDATPAYACSCAEPPSTAPLDQLDAAFVGIAREVVGHARNSYWEHTLVRFEVTEVIKGNVGADAFVMVKSFGDSCGEPRFIPGGRMFGREAGIQISDASKPIVPEACTSNSPDYVRNGVPGLEPLAPDGPVTGLIVGDHRGTSMRLLDENSRTVRYVPEDGLTHDPEVCADGRTLATITDGPTLRWTDLTTLSVIGEVPLDIDLGTDPYPPPINKVSIDRCVDGNNTLVRGPDQLWLASPASDVQTLPYGEFRSGTISSDASTFSWWNSVFEFETSPITADGFPAATVAVSNHRGADLEISPDGDLFAFYRRKPPLTQGDMEIVIVDRSGVEVYALLDPSFFTTYGFRWLDDETLLAGTTLIDLSTPTPTIIDPEPNPYNRWQLQQSIGTHMAAYDDGDWIFVDAVNNTQQLVAASGKQIFGRPLALPAPIVVTAPGLVPVPRPATPLPGERLFTTLDELTQAVIADPTLTLNPKLVREPPESSQSIGQVLMKVVRRRWNFRGTFR